MQGKLYLTALLILSSLLSINAQYHSPVLTGFAGQELLNGLVGNYKPSNILDYDDARDTMFANIYSHNDSLTCVYSGHSIYLNPNQDPTTAAFMNGGTNGINTEHTWPQGFGASSGNARSNIYHLFPTRIQVNGDRGNSPFSEIPDNQTDEWYYLNQSQSSTPAQSVRDLYSEREGNKWEPREDHKGDVARAMFYFYTMYKTEADNADPNFFETQRATLCAWHLEDPVDEKEWQRNLKIAPYQENKFNPFILDCTLPQRCYCEDQNTFCSPTTLAVDEAVLKPFSLEQNFPNPFVETTTIQYQLNKSLNVRLVLYNILGEQVKILVSERQHQGTHQVNFSRNTLPEITPGVYAYCLEVSDGNTHYKESRKLVIWK